LSSAYAVVKDFEQELASYTGTPHVVVVESCTAALFLSLLLYTRETGKGQTITIPRYTYPSAANSIIHAGHRLRFNDDDWQAARMWYPLLPTTIVDSAKTMWRGMYTDICGMMHEDVTGRVFVCLSFHAKKCIPIGRGGAILTGKDRDAEWLRMMRFDGRHETALCVDDLGAIGYNMYMSPEQAARGLELMQWLPDEVAGDPDPYMDLSAQEVYQSYIDKD
jgi:dTDP-4-amino-4,6-dideoxygalactose transaminase